MAWTCWNEENGRSHFVEPKLWQLVSKCTVFLVYLNFLKDRSMWLCVIISMQCFMQIKCFFKKITLLDFFTTQQTVLKNLKVKIFTNSYKNLFKTNINTLNRIKCQNNVQQTFTTVITVCSINTHITWQTRKHKPL